MELEQMYENVKQERDELDIENYSLKERIKKLCDALQDAISTNIDSCKYDNFNNFIKTMRDENI